MDDDLAQFLVLVRALCVSAGLAGLEVETELADGAWVRGVPAAMKGPEAGEYVGDTGYHDWRHRGRAAFRRDLPLACSLSH